MGERSRNDEHVTSRRGQSIDPFGHEETHIARDRKRLIGVGFGSPSLERPAHLQREHGIPARCVMQPRQRRSGHRQRHRAPDDLLQCADTDTLQLQSSASQTQADVLCVLSSVHGRSLRCQQPDPLVAEPMQRERQNAARGTVKPLHVIDAEEKRFGAAQQPEH